MLQLYTFPKGPLPRGLVNIRPIPQLDGRFARRFEVGRRGTEGFG